MAAAVIMPRQGQSVESCVISRWHKKKGDTVRAGELLFSYETDKASFDEEAKVSGTVLEIFFEEGDDVPCLENVCVIGSEGEDVGQFRPGAVLPQAGMGSGGAAQPIPSPTAPEGEGGGPLSYEAIAVECKEPAEQGSQVIVDGMQGSVLSAALIPRQEMQKTGVSPRARNLAEKAGADLRYARSSGPGGRIIERDVTELRKTGPIFTNAASARIKGAGVGAGTGVGAISGSGIGGRITVSDLDNGVRQASGRTSEGTGAETCGNTLKDAGSGAYSHTGAHGYKDIKLTNIRRIIAETMRHSVSAAAQLTLNASFDATDIVGLRKRIKAGGTGLPPGDITLNDIILFAVSRTLKNHTALNAHFLGDRIRCFTNVNIGAAVDTERGLMVPTVFSADLKSIGDISDEVKKLVTDCRAGTINPDLLTGGSFTVTNLGTLGIESFTPILNPPQTGILGVGTITQRARMDGDSGKHVFYPAMGLSLTFDHRALDGAQAARFLQELARNLESFSAFLASQMTMT